MTDFLERLAELDEADVPQMVVNDPLACCPLGRALAAVEDKMHDVNVERGIGTAYTTGIVHLGDNLVEVITSRPREVIIGSAVPLLTWRTVLVVNEEQTRIWRYSSRAAALHGHWLVSHTLGIGDSQPPDLPKSHEHHIA